jgi:hypothetical protein
MNKLWYKETEKEFFRKSLELSSPEKIFYVDNEERFLAYWPKTYEGRKSTLQSRNSLIGNYTEKWSEQVMQQILDDLNLDFYAVQDAVCEELDLTGMGKADLLISKSNSHQQKPEDIQLIFEIKMSLVWNWQYKKISDELICLGDYNSHTGRPGLLRSDSMLKAIGKSIDIRVSNVKASQIPIIILGNTPISDSYNNKVDKLKKAGVIQGFWSLNPEPLTDEEIIEKTKNEGYIKFKDFSSLKTHIKDFLLQDFNFFSSTKTKEELGKIIEISNRQETYEEKATEFLKLIANL